MENQFVSEKQNLSSTQSMFHHNPNLNPESMPSAPPPSYTGPSQFAPPGMLCLQYYPSPAQGMCYPQPYAHPPPVGHPYYPQPGVAYPEPPPDTKYQDAMTQQQQQVVITSNIPPKATPVVADNGVKVSMVGAFVLSCVAYFFGGWVCGAMAFALAFIGRKSAAYGNVRNAVRMRNMSYGLSIFGIISSLILVAIYLGVFLSSAFNSYTWLDGIFPKYNASQLYDARRHR